MENQKIKLSIVIDERTISDPNMPLIAISSNRLEIVNLIKEKTLEVIIDGDDMNFRLFEPHSIDDLLKSINFFKEHINTNDMIEYLEYVDNITKKIQNTIDIIDILK